MHRRILLTVGLLLPFLLGGSIPKLMRLRDQGDAAMLAGDWSAAEKLLRKAAVAAESSLADEALIAACACSAMSRATPRDQFLTWSADIDTGMVGWNVRRVGRTDSRFVLVGDADDLVTSADGGQTWVAPSLLPAGCGAGVQTEGGIAYGDGVLLVVGSDGTACSSTDDGDTFTQTSVGGSVSSHLVWSGSDFVAWGSGVAYRSPDGVAWTSTPISPASAQIGPVAVGDSGTLVAIEGAWGAWYADQQALRSTDGITWTELDATAFTGGHPVRDIAFGYVAPSADCP